MATGTFSQNASVWVSNLKLVSENLPFPFTDSRCDIYGEIVMISLINTSINMLSFSRMANKPYLCLYNNLLENLEHCGGEPEQAATMATHE